MKRYAMRWRDLSGQWHDDDNPATRETPDGQWVDAEEALARIAELETLEQHVRARSAEFAIRSVREIGTRDQRIAELEEKGNEWEARSVRLATRCCEAEARVRELERKLDETTNYAISEASKLRERIRELEESRPMDTAPKEHSGRPRRIVGRLPLPEVKP